MLAGLRLVCIENVVGAPIRPDLVLTGAQFDLPIVRDRVFELSGFAVPLELVRQHRGAVTDTAISACVRRPWRQQCFLDKTRRCARDVQMDRSSERATPASDRQQ